MKRGPESETKQPPKKKRRLIKPSQRKNETPATELNAVNFSPAEEGASAPVEGASSSLKRSREEFDEDTQAQQQPKKKQKTNSSTDAETKTDTKPELTPKELQELGDRLIKAAKSDCLGVINTLIQRGAPVNAANQHGYTALYKAAGLGNGDIVTALLAAPGIGVNAAGEGGRTALHGAAIRGHANVVTTLLAAPGIDVNVADQGGYTALHWAASSDGRIDAVTALLAAPEILANATNNFGHTALHIAASGGHANVVTALLATPGIDVNAADNGGETALHKAARWGHANVVTALLAVPGIDVNVGADLNVAGDHAGDTAIVVAFERGHDAIVALLQQHGAVLPEYLQQEAGPQINGNQSVHKESVHRSVSESALNLKKRYVDNIQKAPELEEEVSGKGKEKIDSDESRPSLDEAREAFVKWVADLLETDDKTQAAKRGIAQLNNLDFTDSRSGITLRDALGLVWLGINDETAYKYFKPLDEIKPLIVNQLYEIQRSYNIASDLSDNGSADVPTCTSGSFNKIIDILNALSHENVCIRYVTPETIIAKAGKVMEEICQNQATHYQNSGWKKDEDVSLDAVNVISEKMQKQLMEEFGDFKKDVPNLEDVIKSSILDESIRVQLWGEIEKLTRASASEKEASVVSAVLERSSTTYSPQLNRSRENNASFTEENTQRKGSSSPRPGV